MYEKIGCKDIKKTNLYQRRLKKEHNITDEEIKERMRWDMPILSENSKCYISLDFPVLNCKPTKACSEVCYACQGPQFYHKAIVKSLTVARMIQEDPERTANKMIYESAGRPIRLAGSGELLPSYKEFIEYLEEYGLSWWGFTRRIDTHQEIPRLMFSLDATTPDDVLDYVHDCVPRNKRSYLYRPGDPKPKLKVAVTFPVHGPLTNYVSKQKQKKSDCPAVRKLIEGCWECRRCY